MIRQETDRLTEVHLKKTAE